MKKLFAILFALTMTVSVCMLAGCGSETATTNEPEAAADAAQGEEVYLEAHSYKTVKALSNN
jgi:hypothetical protein